MTTERGFSVKLSARVDQYIASMRAAASASGEFSKTTQANLKKLGGQMQTVGSSLTRSVSLPLAVAGGAATKMAVDFDTAFTRMQALAGVSAQEIDGLKESVLDLAGETGRAPQELAEGLYFLRSSGLDASAAMDALEVSAKASAAGLGDTAVIADAVSSALNAYATSGLTAAEATDILVQTAKAGKAEPEQLAGALGRVLPIASELGVTFEDVGGAIAALSLSGNDAAQSATLFTNVLSKLLKPSQQGAAALKEVGLSTQAIRDSIASDGLLGTLELLKARLGDSGFVRFLEDAQAVQGALALTGQNAEQVGEAFATVSDHVKATGNAFDTAAGSKGFKLQQALTDMKVAFIQAGDAILPVVAGVAGAIGDLASTFSEMSPAAQKVVLGFVAVVAAAGPLVSIGGKIVSNLGSIATGLGKVGVSAGTANAALAIATAGLVAYSGAAMRAAREQNQFDEILASFASMSAPEAFERLNEAIVSGGFVGKSLVDTFVELARTQQGAALALNDYMLAQIAAGTADADTIERQKVLADAISIVSNEQKIAAANEAKATAAAKENVEALDDEIESRQESIDGLRVLTRNMREGTTAQQENAAAAGANAVAMDELAEGAEAAKQAVNDMVDALLRSVDTQFDVESAQLALSDSVDAYRDKIKDLAPIQHRLNRMRANGKEDTDRYRAAEEELRRAFEDVRQAEIASAEQALEVAKAYGTAEGASEGSRKAIGRHVDMLTILKGQYPELAGEIDGYILKLLAIPPKAPTKAEFLKDAANLDADALKKKYGSIDPKITSKAQFLKDAATLDAQALKDKYDGIDATVDTTANFYHGDADAAIDAHAAKLTALDGRSVDTYTTHHVNTITSHTELNEQNQRALGGYIARPEVAQLHSNEAVLPLSNRGRMDQLVNDPRIRPTILAALDTNMTPAPQYNQTSRSWPAGSNGGHHIEFHNHHRPVTPTTIAQGLRAAELMAPDGVMVAA